MHVFKNSKRILAIAITLMMVLSMVPSMTPEVYAAGTKQDFPLISATGELVADANARYVTTFVQDPATKLITATVEVQNNTTGAGGRNMVINGAGLEISFSNKIAPYAYDPTNLADPHPYDATRLYTGGSNTSTSDFGKYCYAPIATFNTIGSPLMSNDGSKRMMGAKISAGSDKGTLTIAPGTSKVLAQLFFMPMNGTDILDLDMFNYRWETSGLNRISTWLGNGTRLVVSNESFPSASYLYVHSPSTFKVHVKHADPVGLTADPDNRVREIVGYDDSTMEWATDEAGPYTAGAPVISDDAQTIYVKVKGDSGYSGADSEYGNYKMYIASNPVPVEFKDAFFTADTYVKKTSENITTTDGKTHVGDTLRYTIEAGNDGDSRSVWTDVVVTDKLPTGVTFVPGTVKVGGTTVTDNYNAGERTLTVEMGNIPGQTSKEVTFEVTVDGDAHDKIIVNSVTVNGTDGEGGENIEKETEESGGGHHVVGKSKAPTVDPITEGDREVTGTGEPGAKIEVEFPGGKTETATVEADGSWKVTVPNDVDLEKDDVVKAVQKETEKEPSDPVNETVLGRPGVDPSSTKTSQNVSRTDGTNHVGDTLEYTITVKNNGDIKSLWKDIKVIDVLPTQVDFISGSVKIDGVPAGTAADYDDAAGTLTVSVGNIAGGKEKVVTFEAQVNKSAYGDTFKNTASITGDGGEEEIEEPGGGTDVVDKSATPVIDAITEGDSTVTGTGVPEAEIMVTFPGGATVTTTVGNDNKWTVDVPSGVVLESGKEVSAIQKEADKDPSDQAIATVGGRPSVGGKGNIDLEKSSKNTTRDDGTTRVGDTLEYTVTATNQGPEKSLWASAVMTDTLPEGITFVPGSVKINDVTANYTYDDITRLLTVELGDLASGVTKTVVFNAKVNDDAHGKTILNHVKVSGKDGGDGGEDLEKEVDENGDGKTPIDKSEPPLIDEINEGDRIVTGTGIAGATIKVTIPGNAATIDTTVGNDGKWQITVPANRNLIENDEVKAVQIVSDLDPSNPTVETVQAKKTVVPFMEKTSENMSSTDGKTHVGDTIKYTVTIRNDGSSKSVWKDVKLSDTLPAYVTIDTNTVRLDGAVPTYHFYNTGTRTLHVSAGDFAGGVEKVLTFDVTIDKDAYGQSIVNSASVTGQNNGGEEIGTDTTEDGGQNVLDKSKQPDVDDVTRGDEKVTGKGEPGAEIEVTFPDGSKETTTVDPNGEWSVDVPDDIDLGNGDEIEVIQTEDGKDPSDKETVIVGDKDYRAVTGLVYPMISDDLGLGDEFLRKHDIVVELRATFNTPADAALSTTAVFVGDDQGRFTIENVPFGDYVLYIKRPGHLTRCMYVTISESSADLIELTPPGSEGRFNLWFGDVNDDFIVDNLDIMMILEYMEQQIDALDHRYNPACDLNADGLIDNLDIMMVLENLNKDILQYSGAGNVNINE